MTQFTLYTADCIGDRWNASYPHAIEVHDLESFRQAVSRDHVAAKYRDGYAKSDKERKRLIPSHRAIVDFVCADGIMFDVDNTPANENDPDIPPEQWIYPKDVRAAFPGVPFYLAYSRNHMKEKDGRSPRPKFHIYFAIDTVNDAKKYGSLKKRVCLYFPAFDQNAKDAARFFFGVDNPTVEYYGGEGEQ